MGDSSKQPRLLPDQSRGDGGPTTAERGELTRLRREKCGESAIAASGLCAWPIVYRYRYCPNCRREWPARHTSCPACVRWLGDQPLQRTEWQLAPARREISSQTGYELTAASALVLRLVADSPTALHIQAIALELTDALQSRAGIPVCPVPERGWLAWNKQGLRPAFLQARQIEERLVNTLRELEKSLRIFMSFRWGLWLDQFVLPFDEKGTPLLSPTTANVIFNFEPDDVFLCSEQVYNENRHWERFVCVPRRLLGGEELYGYRLLEHKRPSALDHADAIKDGPFLGRENELALLTAWLQQSRVEYRCAALIAEAGSGKTRLVRAWRQQHPGVTMLVANFSLFGGELADFVGQLAALPDDITTDTLLEAAMTRIELERIDVLVFDDLHWADPESIAFLQRLLEALRTRPILVLLMARPSGQMTIEALHPAVERNLTPLPSPIALDLARRTISAPDIASMAAVRSKGNPLFIEQFADWTEETNYAGAGEAPQNLHQVVAARIGYLSSDRLPAIRQKLQWSRSWERDAVHQDLDRLENDIGLWLDRLETGDYGDRLEVSRYLVDLEHLERELFLASTLAGKPRARSSRLREAIERLFVGSADQILTDLQQRAGSADKTDKLNIYQRALRAGDVLAARYNWSTAAGFYELALRCGDPGQQRDLAARLAACRRRGGDASIPTQQTHGTLDLETHPAVDALRLPEVWIALGETRRCAAYFRRAVEAAQAINDLGLAEWARDRAARYGGASSSDEVK